MRNHIPSLQTALKHLVKVQRRKSVKTAKLARRNARKDANMQHSFFFEFAK